MSSERTPLRIFLRIISLQATLILLAITLSALAARYYFKRMVVEAAVPLAEIQDALRVFDASLAVVLLGVAVVLVAFAIWSGKGLVYGEWSELEMSIDDMRKDLESKTESLNLERQELSTLMGAISDGVLSVDGNGAPLYYNSRFEILFGAPGAYSQDVRGVRLFEMFRDPDILNAFDAALRQGRVGTAPAIPVVMGSDGARRFFSLSVSPLKKPNGKVYGAIGIFHDVTELKAAEQMRIDFVANVSHELRTPLTSIKGYTDTIIDDVRRGRSIMPEFLSTIARNVERLMGLINDLLDLSSLESGELLQKARLSTEEITERIVSQMRPAFENKKHAVKVDVVAPFVWADPRRLEQILVNLLDNAIKYTPHEGKITVHWLADASSVYLRVADTGPGIPPEHQARLFERFYRVDKARSRELGGTGLGLAIVKHIMQRHGGSVWVESKQGQGATFICRFPQGDNHASETYSS